MDDNLAYCPVSGDFLSGSSLDVPIGNCAPLAIGSTQEGIPETVDLLKALAGTWEHLPEASNAYLLHFACEKRRILANRNPIPPWMVRHVVQMLEVLGDDRKSLTGVLAFASSAEKGRIALEVDWYDPEWSVLARAEDTDVVAKLNAILLHANKVIQALGEHGAVHGNIRPDFLLLASEGPEFRLAGWGTAWMVAGQRETIFDGLGTSIGDPRTFAPDVVDGTFPSSASDLFAAAVSALTALRVLSDDRKQDPLLGEEGAERRLRLVVNDWISNDIEQDERNAIQSQVEAFLAPNPADRKPDLQPLKTSVPPSPDSTPDDQEPRSGDEDVPEAGQDDNQSDAPAADAPAAAPPRSRAKTVLIGIAVLIPIFLVSLILSALFYPRTQVVPSPPRQVSSPMSAPDPAASSSAPMAAASVSAASSYSPALNPLFGKPSPDAGPMDGGMTSACVPDLEKMRDRAEADLQFYGEKSALILCGRRKGDSLCCDSLKDLKDCADIAGRRIRLSVTASDERSHARRLKALRREAQACEMRHDSVREVDTPAADASVEKSGPHAKDVIVELGPAPSVGATGARHNER